MTTRDPNKKEAVLAAIDDAWREMRRSLASLTSRDMEVPGANAAWSIKDLLGHITTWEQVLLDKLDGKQPAKDFNVDRFNEAEVAVKSGRPVRDVMTELEAVHRALRDALALAPESYFAHGSATRRWIDENTILHYQDHIFQIRNWLRSRLATTDKS